MSQRKPEGPEGLGTVLHRATDAVEPTGLADLALTEAGRRRRRRREAVAALAAVVLVGSTSIAVEVLGRDDGSAETRPGPAATIAPTPTDPGAPDPAATDPAPGRELVEGTQPQWDPRDVDRLPAAPPGTVPGLPSEVVAPASAPALAGSPLEAAVLGLRRQNAVLLLGTDGSWRSVPLSAEYPRTALSPSGTSLAVWAYGDGPGAAVTVHDVTTGTTTTVPYPTGFRPFDFQTWVWLDDATLLLDDGRGGWVVEVPGGRAERIAGPGQGAAGVPWTVASDGSLVEVTGYDQPAELVDRAGGGDRRVTLTATGRLLSLAADEETVVGTSFDERPFSVLVADRQTVRPRAVLPIRDPQANYSNWALGVLALREDGTVLLRVAVPGTGGMRVVRWDPASGALTLVAVVEKDLEDEVDLASGFLRG